MMDFMSTAAPAHTPLGKLILRRVIMALVFIVLILVPALILFAMTRQPVTTYAALGSLVGAIAVMAGGIRIGVLATIVASLLAPVAIVAGLSPFTGAALMAVMTMYLGFLSRFGLHKAAMLVPIMLAWPMLSPVPWLPVEAIDKVNALLAKGNWNLADVINKVQDSGHHASTAGSAILSKFMTNAEIHLRMDTNYLIWVAVSFFIGSIVPVIVLPLLTRKAPKPKLEPHSRSEAVPYTITITVLTAVATYYFLDHPKLVAGSFMIASILVLTQVGGDIQWKLTLQRVFGTIGGFGLMALLVLIFTKPNYVEIFGVPVPGTLYLVGLIFGTLAIVAKFSPRQWIYYILIVPATACLNAISFPAAGNLNEQRLIDNLVGAALVILAALITLFVGKFTAKPTEALIAKPLLTDTGA